MGDDTEPDDLGERVSHLEGVAEAEDKATERGRHAQVLLISLVAIIAGGVVGSGVALLVYLLNRLDTIQAMIPRR